MFIHSMWTVSDSPSLFSIWNVEWFPIWKPCFAFTCVFVLIFFVFVLVPCMFLSFGVRFVLHGQFSRKNYSGVLLWFSVLRFIFYPQVFMVHESLFSLIPPSWSQTSTVEISVRLRHIWSDCCTIDGVFFEPVVAKDGVILSRFRFFL